MPAISLLAKSYTYTNGNPNDADEVELDLANTFANFSTIQTDYNQLVTGAYTIAGVKTFSSAPKIDQINPATSNGATALTLAGAGVNAQTGATYTIVTGDRYKLVTLNNASAVAVTLPQAGSTGFGNNFEVEIANRGAGLATVTPTTSTVDGAVSITLSQNQSARFYSDGTNYFTSRGRATAPIFTKSFTSTAQTITSGGSLTLPHSMGEAPKMVFVRLKCTSAEGGWSVGDEFRFMGLYTSDTSGRAYGFTCELDATNLNIRYGSYTNTFRAHRKDTGAVFDLTNASWEAYFEAYA